MLFSDANGRKVVSTTTAETIGKLHDYVVDPSGPRVAAMLLKKTDKGIGDTLRWADIVAFGADAVTVESTEKVTESGDDLAPLLDKRNHLHKKRVLTTIGDDLGSVKDIDFDESTGVLNFLVLDDKAKSQVAAARLVGVGSYAVVVQADAPGASLAQPPAGAQATVPPATPAAAPPAPSPALDAPPAAPAGIDQAQRASYPPTT